MTPETQHTPGPWTVTPSGGVITDNDDPEVICWTEINDIMAVEREANARLIAAAPALLAACEAALPWVKHAACDVMDQITDNLRRALRGTSPDSGERLQLEGPRRGCDEHKRTLVVIDTLRAAIAKAKGGTVPTNPASYEQDIRREDWVEGGAR